MEANIETQLQIIKDVNCKIENLEVYFVITFIFMLRLFVNLFVFLLQTVATQTQTEVIQIQAEVKQTQTEVIQNRLNMNLILTRNLVTIANRNLGRKQTEHIPTKEEKKQPVGKKNTKKKQKQKVPVKVAECQPSEKEAKKDARIAELLGPNNFGGIKTIKDLEKNCCIRGDRLITHLDRLNESACNLVHTMKIQHLHLDTAASNSNSENANIIAGSSCDDKNFELNKKIYENLIADSKQLRKQDANFYSENYDQILKMPSPETMENFKKAFFH